MAFDKNGKQEGGAVAQRYKKVSSEDRVQFLNRARHNAVLTIPSLMPLEGYDGRSHLIEPYSGLGAAGVVHLSSRLTMALLPAGRPHMRMDLPPQALVQFGAGGVPKDIEVGLAQSEKLVQAEVEDKGWRPSTLMALQQQLVAGNHLEHQLEDNTIRIFRLDQFVVRRDWAGNALEVILEERLTPDTLPEGMTVSGMDAQEELRLYTHIGWDGGSYTVHQETGDGQAMSPKLKYDRGSLPYNPVRWSKTPGEDYGRSFVEEHIADIRSLDGLTKAELEMAAMASRNFIAIRPGAVGTNVKRRLTQAVNGDVLMMDPDSVDLKSFDNVGGFQLVNMKTQQLTEQLSRAFLLLSVGQRNAERVTATEIERDIQELEAALGGNFSTLNTDMMERRTVLLMRNMEAARALPEGLLENGVRPTVLTGLEALSRERDVARVQQLAQLVTGFGETAVDNLRLNKILARATVGLGFPDVVRSDEEIAEIQKQRQQEQLAQQVAGPIAAAAAQAGSQEESKG